MGLLDKAEEMDEKPDEEEEEEDLYAEEPKKKKGKKKGLGKKKSVGKKRKKKKADDDDDEYYSAAPSKKKKSAKKKKRKKSGKKATVHKGEEPGEERTRIDPRELPYAPLWKRFAAVAVDYVLILVMFGFIMVFVVQDVIVDNRKLAPIYWAIILIVLPLVYFFIFDGILGGRSIGKQIFGTEIINQYGQKPTVKEGLVSAVGKTLLPLFLVPAVPIWDMSGLFMGRSSRFYQRKTEHKMHLFVVDHTKFRGLDGEFSEEEDYFGFESEEEDGSTGSNEEPSGDTEEEKKET